MELDDPLNKNVHYQAVRKALLKVRPQWRNIGLALGIPVFKLDEFTGSLEENMDQIVKVWLNHTYSTPTWRKLIKALRDDTVEGGKPVADEIEKNCRGGQSVSQAFQRGESGSQSATTGTSQSHDSSYLQQSYSQPSTYDSGISMSGNSQPQSQAAFRCPCGKCSLDQFLLKGCPTVSSPSKYVPFPYMDTNGLTEDDKSDLEHKLIEETNFVIKQFGSLVIRTSKSLKKEHVTPQELANCLVQLEGFVSDIGQNLLGDHEKELIEAGESGTIDSIFIILGKYRYWSFLNYDILDHVISELGTDDDQSRLEGYHSYFHDYCKRSVFQVPRAVYSDKEATREKFAVKLVETLRSTLVEVDQVRRRIAKVLGLKSSALFLSSVEEGCIKLHFLVPECIAKRVFPPSFAQLATLATLSITFLKYRGKIYICQASKCVPDVLEIIFSQLSLQDLLLNCRLVCKQWNVIIKDETFLRWKKLYFMYKAGQQEAMDEVKYIIYDEALDQDIFLLNIGRCFKTFFPTMKGDERSSVLASLRSKPQFQMAQKILEACASGNETDPCVFLPLMSICSRSVHELYAVLVALRRVLHPDRWAKLTDSLFCLATLFFALWNDFKMLPPRSHYYMYYSLMILEQPPLQSSESATYLGVKRPDDDSKSIREHISNSDEDSSSQHSTGNESLFNLPILATMEHKHTTIGLGEGNTTSEESDTEPPKRRKPKRSKRSKKRKNPKSLPDAECYKRKKPCPALELAPERKPPVALELAPERKPPVALELAPERKPPVALELAPERKPPVALELAPERKPPVALELAPERKPPVALELAPERKPPVALELAPERKPPVALELAPERKPPVALELAPERKPPVALELAPERKPPVALELALERKPPVAPGLAPERKPPVALELAPERKPPVTPGLAPERKPPVALKFAPERKPPVALELAPDRKPPDFEQSVLPPTVIPKQERKREWQPPVLKLTPEQMRVVNERLEPGKMIRVMALAGTGKTSTLVKFAEARPDWKFLYCVFNRSMQEDAMKKFPDNVTATTIHSIASKALDVKKRFKKKRGDNLKEHDIMQYISKPLIYAKPVLKTLEKFLASGSDDKTPSEEHLPLDLEPEAFDEVLDDAKDIWKRMIDPTDLTVKITHDGYLKLYQTQKPTFERCDCILIDEAQDLTPAQISILMRQSCSKVVVGDGHQQIYSFRGAVNALVKVKDHVSRTLHLTQSFRFGPEIAYVVSCLLDDLKHERRRTMIGGLQDGGVDGKQEGQLAIISRYNKTLFDQMVDVYRYKPPSVKIGFAGDEKSYELDMILDVYKLMNGKTNEIQCGGRRFRSFDQLNTYARDPWDSLIMRSIRICRNYGDEIPLIVDNIKERTTECDQAEIIFSTGHKAKGLEFDTVKVTDDIMNEGEYQSKDADYRNLVYVATTRAMKRLILPQVLVNVLHKTGEDFIFPVPPSRWLKQLDIYCPICKLKKPTPTLQFEKLELKLADGKMIPGGIICENCLGKYLPFMKPVLKMSKKTSSKE